MGSSRQIAKSLRPWRLRIWSAHVAAFCLGGVAAILGLLIGPAMQLLLGPQNALVRWDVLLGGYWAHLLISHLPGDGLAASEVFRLLPIALVTVATIKSLLTAWQWYTWEFIGERVAYGWRQSLVEAFTYVDPRARDAGAVAREESDLGGLMSQDIRTCRDYLVHFFGGLPREGLQTIFIGVSLALLSPKLFAIFMLSIAPVGAMLARLGKKLRRRASAALENNSFLGEWIQQRLLGLETIKHYQTEAFEVSAMRRASHRLFVEFSRAARLKARTSPMIELFGVVAITVALYVAFSDIASGRLSGAVAMSFFSSLTLFAQSAAKLGRYFNSNREGLAAADRIFSAMDGFERSRRSKLLLAQSIKKSNETKICVQNISLFYGETSAVSAFSYEFKSGQVYCIVGASGAGKSSLFNLLLGLCAPQTGTIEFFTTDQFSNRTMDMVYMPQAVAVISCDLAENVSYPLIDSDLERAQCALDHVGFRMDAARLPQGLRTRVGADGLKLSGGQAQRLQLARLAYHRAPFVLVDEGTSALDPEMEKIVLAKLRDLAAQGAVVIAIAHRRAAVDASDQVLVMKAGRLVAHGLRHQVVSNPLFQEVFQ
jgi:subfamily B ATP-binding cassette protein MsbA